MDAVSQSMVNDEIVYLTKQQFKDLPSYDLSIPTGPRIGKQWKQRRRNKDGWLDTWDMAESVPYDPSKHGELSAYEKLATIHFRVLLNIACGTDIYIKSLTHCCYFNGEFNLCRCKYS